MEKWVSYFLNRPVLVKVVVFSIVVLGLRTVFKTPKEGMPKLSFNKILGTIVATLLHMYIINKKEVKS